MKIADAAIVSLLLFSSLMPVQAQWGTVKVKGNVEDGNIAVWTQSGQLKDSGIKADTIAAKYPVFNIPLDGGSYTEVELKCSTNNFAPTHYHWTGAGVFDLVRVADLNGRSRWAYNESGPGDGAWVEWNGTTWVYTMHSNGTIQWQFENVSGYFPQRSFQSIDGIDVSARGSIDYYYDSFVIPPAGHAAESFYDYNARLYYARTGGIMPSRSHQLLTGVLSSISSTVKFVTIWPDVDAFPWMTPDNPNLTWSFSRRHPVTGAESNSQSEEVLWHPIEPIWKSYRK